MSTVLREQFFIHVIYDYEVRSRVICKCLRFCGMSVGLPPGTAQVLKHPPEKR